MKERRQNFEERREATYQSKVMSKYRHKRSEDNVRSTWAKSKQKQSQPFSNKRFVEDLSK